MHKPIKADTALVDPPSMVTLSRVEDLATMVVCLVEGTSRRCRLNAQMCLS